MTAQTLATVSPSSSPSPVAAPDAIEQALVSGDLSRLNPSERLAYYRRVCESLGLNYLTQPFQYLVLNGRLTLYATRACADQLRRLHGVSIDKPEVRIEEGMVIVSVSARTADGRTDHELGVVSLEGLRGEARANALLKAVTKAKRRVTLSICGLGWLDETEVDTIPDARPVAVEEAHGQAQAPEAASAPAAPAALPDDGGGPATDAQLRKAWVLAKRAGFSEQDFKDLVRERYNLTSVRALSKAQASELIEFLGAATAPESDPAEA
jgi:hypothetical protein